MSICSPLWALWVIWIKNRFRIPSLSRDTPQRATPSYIHINIYNNVLDNVHMAVGILAAVATISIRARASVLYVHCIIISAPSPASRVVLRWLHARMSVISRGINAGSVCHNRITAEHLRTSRKCTKKTRRRDWRRTSEYGRSSRRCAFCLTTSATNC